MKKIINFLGSRMFITGLLILVQAAWLTIWFFRLTQYAHWISIVFTVISVLISLYIVNKNENPAYKIAWILLIAIVPAFGGLMYLAIGNKRPFTFRMERYWNGSGKKIHGQLPLPITYGEPGISRSGPIRRPRIIPSARRCSGPC